MVDFFLMREAGSERFMAAEAGGAPNGEKEERRGLSMDIGGEEGQAG